MKISTDLKNAILSEDKPGGGYEWWYFDGLSEDRTSGFVIIVYHGNPFSTKYIGRSNDNYIAPAQHPAISISVYENEKTIYYSFLEYGEEEFEWNEDNRGLKIGNDSIRMVKEAEQIRYELSIDQKLDSGHLLKGLIRFDSVVANNDLISGNEDEDHSWNLIQPKARVSADLKLGTKKGRKEFKFIGEGYHDHNSGAVPMKESFRDWYWGRYHFKNSTLIYYLRNRLQDQQFEAWLFDGDNQQIIQTFREIETDYYSRNLFGLKSAKKIILTSPDTKITIQTPLIIDNGPFYQRFFGDAVMNRKEELEAARGISEYIYPKNIYNKKFWPLVHMRLRFVQEKPNWVQKSHLMYPWTW